MGYTRPAVKNRWNRAHYDTIASTIPKGFRARLQAYCYGKCSTVNAMLKKRILDDLAKEEAEAN